MNRCIQNKNNAELRVKLEQVAQCFSVASDLLSVGVQSQAGAHYGVPLRELNADHEWHSGIFFHSSAETKNRGYFNEDTFNDVPTPIN